MAKVLSREAGTVIDVIACSKEAAGAEALKFYGVTYSPTAHLNLVAHRFRSMANHQ